MLLNCGVGEDSWGPLDCKEIKPVNRKESQSWIFIGRTDAEAETPIPWPPEAKNWLIWKDPDAGKDWEQEEKGMTEDEMCREPAWGTPPMAKVMRKEAWHTQRRDQASGNPLFPSIYPKTRVCFMLSPTPLTLRGALPHNHFSRRRS